MKKASKVAKPSARKKTTAKKKTKNAILATCPVGNASWCSYPFTVNQLQKRLKKIAEGAKEDSLQLSR